MRSDLKTWEFTVHPNESSVTQVEKDLKLPYFILDEPPVADKINNTFTSLWPSQAFGQQINLPTNSNTIGGIEGIKSEVTIKSLRAFRYQPGRISGFTYGVKVSEIGAGPGTVLEFGIENATDSYMFRLTNGTLFSIVRRSIVPLDNTPFLSNANYAANTKTVVVNNITQYETVIEQKYMNGDPLSGEGKSGYFINPDTVTMYKIEFGWYGAIGARFYAYVPVGSGDCRWVTMHTLVIENQLGKPCLGDPFFYFKYRLKIQDSSTIRINQNLSKYGASYYIDGYDKGTLYSLNAQSRVRYLPNPSFTESKTQLNSIDWVTVLGIKPKRYVINRYGNQFFNKKEIFPEKLMVRSQQDCEIRVIRQRGCPEWAFTHQEGYTWDFLPEERRLKGKFVITPYYSLNYPALGISLNDPKTHTAIATYNAPATGSFRDPSDPDNWADIGNQAIRPIGTDLYALFTGSEKDFSQGAVTVKFYRDEDFRVRLSSNKPLPTPKGVYLPFLYPLSGANLNGYDIEFEYFRRDQILLSTVDVVSSEFYIFFTGGESSLLSTSDHVPTIRFGLAWPSTDPTSELYATELSNGWGIENSPQYDQQTTFYEGLPYDYAADYPNNCLYYETSAFLVRNRFNLESGEYSDYDSVTELDKYYPQVPGSDGGKCRGLYCKAGRELRENVTIFSEVNPTTSVTTYYLSDNTTPWPNLGTQTYTVTLTQGAVVRNVTTSGGIIRTVGEITQFLLPLGTSLPNGISSNSLVNASYSTIYIGSIDRELRLRSILVSKIAPGYLPFVRVFLQARQGVSIGGVWIGQKTSDGIKIEPFTPHRCTLSISDTGVDSHGELSLIHI